MSIFSKIVGKIPVVGHALNEVGKFLPSAGGLIGGALGGGTGQLVGGLVDPNATTKQKILSSIAPLAAGALGAGAGGVLPAVGSFVKDHWQDLAKLGLGVGAAREGLKNNQQSNQLTKDALSKLNSNPSAPDLSSMFADPGNPYAKNRKIPVVGRMA